MAQMSDSLKARSAIVISDVHVDEWVRELPERHEEKRQAFLDFLRWVKEDSGAQHLVINGDLLDIPQKGGKPLLPAFLDVLAGLVDLYRGGVGISHVIGNHDAGILGFASKMREIPLTIDYPCLAMESGDARIIIEHGHLLDAWLWRYVEHRIAALCIGDMPNAVDAMRQFTVANSEVTEVKLPAAHTLAGHLFASLQWEPNGLNFTDEETRLAISLMAQDLSSDFQDVRAADEPFPERDAALSKLDELGLSVDQLLVAEDIPGEAFGAFAEIGNVYYAKIPWRRAARHRLRQVSEQLGCPCSAVVLGHVHKIDHAQWEEDGRELHYYNDGCWKQDKADFLYVENGKVSVYERRWTDPLP